MTRRSLAIFALVMAATSCGGSKKSAKMGPGPAQYKVRLQTTKGDVVILVHREVVTTRC